MSSRRKTLVAALLSFTFLIICQNLVHSASAIERWIPLGTDPFGDAFIVRVATSERRLGYGELWKGDYTYTHESESKREYLRETEIDGGYRISWLYTFSSIPSPRDETVFYIEARTTEDDKHENMSFWWSPDAGGPWSFLGNVSSAPERLYGPWEIHDNSARTVYIKMNDTIRDERKRSGILIDHMYIRCFFNMVDKLDLYFFNDGVFAYFNETLAAAPDPSSFTYVVYLDKPVGGAYPQDFRLVYSSSMAVLQRWNGSKWIYDRGITVTVGTSPFSIAFNVSLSALANPDIQQDTKVWFEDYHGANCYRMVLDRAPNTGGYFISSDVIPELPWPTPLVFIPAVLATVYLLSKRGIRRHG